MAYYTKVLQPGETVLFVGHLHWLIYRHAIWLSVMALIALGFGAGMDGDKRLLLFAIAAVLALCAVGAFLRSWFHRWSTEIVVTDKRIIHKEGWLARRTEEMNVARVETVDVTQGVGGRLLDYGTVMIRGTGGGWEPLRDVADPLRLRSAIIVG